ncbi:MULTISPECIES: hypothetical protein [unclassified Erwinia]|uniref:hypothetical protein n=1 Tax=unclassified Erwinia TaxID=2622719 RepID=UPI000C1A70AB|nr:MULTISPECIES: hypothetical protein [unclassified Erwinia]PIJ51722.1 hypothetical protein BV501_03275 [Erwinia sp. OAMSP11]PIJ84914.1 hypothetical protein BLD47_01500 [Erwinia sp. OLCASP19]PIJ86693.1 hypothetical protein BLD46_03100 [Erwinia sp. OLMTSP26]PIJ88134.1 hypothetical protein BLD49_03780 [Erwinia sp. OLMDSP33]
MKPDFLTARWVVVSLLTLLSCDVQAAESDTARAAMVQDDHGLVVTFSASQSKQLYHYLEKVEQQEGYAISSGAAGSIYLTSPAVSCRRINPGNYGRSEKDDSADLYHCAMRIDSHGVSAPP